MRIGQGYDIHKLVDDRLLILGGINIPYEKGLLGHSDADVLIHAIIDSILGAANLGDIGSHFPDTDPKFKGADSIKLLLETAELLKEAQFKIINIDTTIICQKPKLAPYLYKMKEKIAAALEININQISIKAKTKEGQDSAGMGLSIEAQAICLIDNI